MAISKSGRIVVDLGKEQKQALYAALRTSNQSLKSWLVQEASEFCYAHEQRYLFSPSDICQSPKRVDNADSIESPLRVVSLFSGCGGLDLGFQGGFEFLGANYPRLPFDIVWANELNEKACETYRQNIGSHIFQGDIWERMDELPDNVDVVIGGFPCQDISINGKRTGVKGERSGLYRAMVEAVRRCQPAVFVAENVKGLLMQYNKESLKQVIDDFRSLGYDLDCSLYHAADYGVPQTRERVFIVGTRSPATRYSPPMIERRKEEWITAEEALSDLCNLDEDPSISHIWSRAKKSGEQGNRKLKPDRPGYTIRAECHGNVQFHWQLPRRMSMRECARIQSFPDEFHFTSGLRETERQIGNAVPPVLGWHVANRLIDVFPLGYGQSRQRLVNQSG